MKKLLTALLLIPSLLCAAVTNTMTGTNVVPSGSTLTGNSGSTFTINGAFNASVTGGTMDFHLGNVIGTPLYVDSLSYGMVGDGATDNTTALQNAVNAAAASNSKTLLIRAASNTYNFSGRVIIPPGITIRGETTPGGDIGGYSPWTANPFKVHLKFTGTTSDALYAPTVSSNHFENFELEGSSTATGTGLAIGNAMFLAPVTTSSGSADLTNVVMPLGFYPRAGLILTNEGSNSGSPIPAPVTLTATLTSGSPTFTVSSATGLANGMAVSGTGIPPGATMTISGTTVTLSANATANGSESITFSTAIVSWNASTHTITMSNNATLSHAFDGTTEWLSCYDSIYPNGSNFPRFAGQKVIMQNVYIHDFDVPFSSHYCDGIDIVESYLGNGHIANVVLEANSDVSIRRGYIGGTDFPSFNPYPEAYGIFCIETGTGCILENLQINVCGTALWGTSEANFTLLNLDWEVVGTVTHPGLELHNASSVWGSDISTVNPGVGATPIRVIDSTVKLRDFPGAAGTNPTGTITNGSPTVSSMSPTDTAIIKVGWIAKGTGIPSLTYVTAVASTTVTMSNNATTSATESISFFPAPIQTNHEDAVSVDATGAGVPFEVINGTTLAPISVFLCGQTISRITHGTLPLNVSLPGADVNYSGAPLLVDRLLLPSIASLQQPTAGLNLDGGGLQVILANNIMWNISGGSLIADATHNTNAQLFVGDPGFQNRPVYAFASDGGASGLDHRDLGAGLVANNLDGLWLAPSGSTVDLRLYRTMTASGTDGAQTINKPAGCVQFAAAASSLVVTDSVCTTTSHITATVAGHDANHPTVSVVAGSGSFTIYLDPAPAAETQVNFIITN